MIHLISCFRNAAHRFRHDFQSAGRSAQIGMKPFPPIRRNERALVLGAEDDVNVQAEVGGGHGVCFPAPLPGRLVFMGAVFRGCYPRLISGSPPG